jgi:hypothetical protein
MYQQPTLSGVHVRSIRDALHIFYAVARHVLPIISRRLDPDERKSIAPGNVYVWEERSANSDAAGLTMERWYASPLFACFRNVLTHCPPLLGPMA